MKVPRTLQTAGLIAEVEHLALAPGDALQGGAIVEPMRSDAGAVGGQQPLLSLRRNDRTFPSPLTWRMDLPPHARPPARGPVRLLAPARSAGNTTSASHIRGVRPFSGRVRRWTKFDTSWSRARSEGTCDPRISPGGRRVRARLPRARRGSALRCACITRERVVVDLWGGIARPDTRTPWTRDTRLDRVLVHEGRDRALRARARFARRARHRSAGRG
jgi:hypothetical protein